MTQSPVGTGLEILEAMRQGVDYRLQINVRSFNILVRPISIGETLQVAQDVVEAMNRLSPNARTAVVEHTLMAKYTLIRASSSDIGVSDSRITDYVLDRFTPDEIALLFQQYVSACDKVNPSLEVLSQERIEEMVSDLKKSPSEAIERSFLDLVNIVRFLLTKDG